MKSEMKWVCYLAVMFLLFTGCSKKEETTDKQVENQNTVETKTSGNVNTCSLDKIIELWDAGQAKDAVDIFVNFSWNSPDLYDKGSIFLLSEKEFVAFSQAERDSISQKSMKMMASLRPLARQVVTEGQTYENEGKTDIARKYFLSVRQCGESLNNDKHLLSVKMVGKAIQELGTKKLNEL